MRQVYYRTVRNNKVKLLGKVLSCPNLQGGELDGKRLCFVPYDEFDAGGLAQLWGTEKLAKVLETGTDEEFRNSFDESVKLLAPDGHFRWTFWKEYK